MTQEEFEMSYSRDTHNEKSAQTACPYSSMTAAYLLAAEQLAAREAELKQELKHLQSSGKKHTTLHETRLIRRIALLREERLEILQTVEELAPYAAREAHI